MNGLLIKNCKFAYKDRIEEGDILIEGERIKKIAKEIKRGSSEIINARGKFVIPGIIDAHVHVRDFEESYKEDFISCSKAALSSGVTTIIEMPNTKPSIDSYEIFKKRVSLAENKSLCDFATYFMLREDNLGEIARIEEIRKKSKSIEKPPVGYKAYIDHGLKYGLISHAYNYLRRISFHAEDHRIIERNLKFLHALNLDNFLSHARIREDLAELTAVSEICNILKEKNKEAYFCHLTLAKSIEEAKKAGAFVEVALHHLILHEKHLLKFKGIAKVNPPLRSELESMRLRKMVNENKADVIASDHAPHAIEEKRGNAIEASSGIANLDVFLKVLLTLINKDKLDLIRTINMITKNPAEIFGIKNKGEIKEGNYADLVIVDMKRQGVIKAEEFYSKAKHSPFDRFKYKGEAETAILRGKIAYSDGEFFVKPGYGRYAELIA